MRVILVTVVFLLTFLSAKETKFIVGVENIAYLPYWEGTTKEYKGASREILDAFAKSKGYTFVYKPLPIKRLYREFFSKIIDFKYPDNPLWRSDLRKDKKIFYSNKVLIYIDGTLVKKENKGKGIKILGTVSGFTPWTYLSLIKQNKIKMKENHSIESLLRNTKKGFVDGAYFNVEVAKHILSSVYSESKSLVFDESLPFTKDGYRLSSLKHKKIIDEFNNFLKHHQDLIEKIKRKYKINLK